VTGAGFQGFGSEGARARRDAAKPIDRQQFIALLKQMVDPRGALHFGQQGLEVLVDSDTLQLVPGSPVRIAARPQAAVAAVAATVSQPVATGYRQVVMESGVTPPAPLVNSDGTDWLYSSQTYE
jgi:hypothetical protein